MNDSNFCRSPGGGWNVQVEIAFFYSCSMHNCICFHPLAVARRRCQAVQRYEFRGREDAFADGLNGALSDQGRKITRLRYPSQLDLRTALYRHGSVGKDKDACGVVLNE